MTVKQLIEELEKMPQDLPVYIDEEVKRCYVNIHYKFENDTNPLTVVELDIG